MLAHGVRRTHEFVPVPPHRRGGGRANRRAVLGARWEEFRDRCGDWGRDAALDLGRQRGRLKLQQLGRLSGGVGYTAVASPGVAPG